MKVPSNPQELIGTRVFSKMLGTMGTIESIGMMSSNPWISWSGNTVPVLGRWEDLNTAYPSTFSRNI